MWLLNTENSSNQNKNSDFAFERLVRNSTTTKHQLTIAHCSPLAMIVAREMPGAPLHSSRVCVVCQHPTVLNKKTRFCVGEVSKKFTKNKAPTEIRSPLTYGDDILPRDTAGTAPQLQGAIFYKHPTVLMAGMRIFAMPWMHATVDAARAVACPIAAPNSIVMRT